MADNTVTVVGNVTRDPEIRYTAGGAAEGDVRPGREPAVAEPPDQGVGGADLLLQRRVLAGDGRERGRVRRQGHRASWSPAGSSSAAGRPRTARSASVVEIVADEIGPSLRWATAAITRNERRDGGFGGSGGPAVGSGGPGGGGGGGRPAPDAAPAPSYDDFGEEPF